MYIAILCMAGPELFLSARMAASSSFHRTHVRVCLGSCYPEVWELTPKTYIYINGRKPATGKGDTYLFSDRCHKVVETETW